MGARKPWDCGTSMAGTSSTVGNSGPFEVVEEMRVIHRQNASVPFQGSKTCREGGLCLRGPERGWGPGVPVAGRRFLPQVWKAELALVCLCLLASGMGKI